MVRFKERECDHFAFCGLTAVYALQYSTYLHVTTLVKVDSSMANRTSMSAVCCNCIKLIQSIYSSEKSISTKVPLRVTLTRRNRRSWRKFVLDPLICGIALTFLHGCGGTDDSEPESIPFSTLDQGSESSIGEFRTVVARTQSDWVALWADHTRFSGRSPPLAMPSVSFSSSAVLGVFIGGRPNGCYSVAITQITRYESKLEVLYKEEKPNGAGCASVVTSPFHMVTIPVNGLPVSFKEM